LNYRIMAKLLLLEDDQSFGYILSEYLMMKDLEVDWVPTAEQALERLMHHPYELAIFDIMLPGMSGLDLAKILRDQAIEVPFIFLSAKSLKVDQLKGFQLGAVDYITKPVDEELLVAKIKAMLDLQRKQQPPESAAIPIGKYLFLRKQYQLQYQGETLKLTARESELLALLCAHHQQLLPRKKALSEIWGSTDEFSRKSMDVFISRLRKYLSKDPTIKIENIHGKGFIFIF
ncbi:MAG: response regulator transcription factor, partial [Bacteroidota bacterium]